MNRKGEKNDKENIVRELHGLELFDPNVMFALCCGTRSSPAVSLYILYITYRLKYFMHQTVILYY